MTHSLISRFTKTQLGQAVLLAILVVIGTVSNQHQKERAPKNVPFSIALALLQQLQDEFGRNGVTDARGIGQRRLLGALDKHHVDNAQDLTAVNIQQRATAVAWIGCGIKLKNIKAAAAQAGDGPGVELLRIGSGQRNRGD